MNTYLNILWCKVSPSKLVSEGKVNMFVKYLKYLVWLDKIGLLKHKALSNFLIPMTFVQKYFQFNSKLYRFIEQTIFSLFYQNSSFKLVLAGLYIVKAKKSSGLQLALLYLQRTTANNLVKFISALRRLKSSIRAL